MFKLVLKKIPKITFNHCLFDAKGIMQKFHYNNFLNNRGLLKWAWPYHADQTLTVLATQYTLLTLLRTRSVRSGLLAFLRLMR